MNTSKLTHGGLLLALGIVLPYLFHLTGISGKIFLPMHFPPLIAGFIIGPLLAGIIGALLPLLNFLVSGMPPMPAAIFMVFELAAFGVLTGILYRRYTLYSSLVVAMIGGRVIYGLLFSLLISFENPLVIISGGIATGFPGIILQLVLIPAIVAIIERQFNPLSSAHTG